MANHELRSLDLAIDSRDIDAAEKKIRSLDRILEQTQRRAIALGKTRMRPSITLEDRFTETAIRLSATMKRLNQAAARPVAELIDLATPKIAEIRGALQELSRTRWRVEVEGTAWGAVIGDSFDEWVGAEGQSTLQRISATLGEALGSGLRGFILDALGLGESKEVRYERVVDYLENNPVVEESLYAEAGRKAGDEFFQAFLGAFDLEQISGKLCNLKCDSGNTGMGFYGVGDPGLDLFDPELLNEFRSEALKEYVFDKGDEFIKKNVGELHSTFEENKKWDLSNKPWVKKVKNAPIGWLAKNAWKKAPIIGTILGAIDVIRAEPGRARAEAFGSLVGSTVLGGVGGYVGTLIGGPGIGFLGSVAGGMTGDHYGGNIGGAIFDWFYKKESHPFDSNYPMRTPKGHAYSSSRGKFGQTIDIEQRKHEIFFGTGNKLSGTPLTDEEILSKIEYFNSLKPLPVSISPCPEVAAPQPTTEITINMPPGMIQIHQHQEIDIESLTIQVSTAVAEQLGRSMRNMI
ncbi:hypothetical protein ACE3MQ_15370 [Paenibacillus lentus]|uniref:hypothetical protein n=1 Tax=Paenibacillus lentus TaxID=1338368 RepID=UPI00364BBB48